MKNTRDLLQTHRELGLQVKIQNTMHIVLSRRQSSRQNHNLLNDNKAFENVAKFMELGMTETNQNCIHEEIKSR
jgi:hypothetical protein